MARGCEPPDPRVRRHAAAGPPAFARNALGGAASSVYPFFLEQGRLPRLYCTFWMLFNHLPAWSQSHAADNL